MATLIIGGGAAGLMAASFCPEKALLIDRLCAPGRKLLATGGGRCNLTHNIGADGIAAAFGPRAGRFPLPALRAFPPDQIRAFFRSRGVETRADADGCVFPLPDKKASDVLDALLQAARQNGAEIRSGVRATRLLLEPDPASSDTSARRVCGALTTQGPLQADRIILAAGGQSYPELGSDGSGFTLAREAGLAVVTPVPALAGLTAAEAWPATLAGVVCDRGGMRLEEDKRLTPGPVLFTHRGLSGPPALALSGEIAARLQQADKGKPPAPSVTVRVSFIAERTAADWLSLFSRWRADRGGRALHNLLSGELPRALAVTLCGLAGASEIAAARAGKATLQALAAACADLPLHITGTEGWHRAMATRGGVALGELDPKTLECRRIRNLFCAGEVVDLDAPCGGFNLTWAFASGRLAALAQPQSK